ncbi:multiple epidermal growth factor-like domains protein 11 [Pristis pectinata]|uniref:multiple epidermal growth factor-like domains protein 11 n=1 Tax=Pristis pectinata TaxID=685728 RepID=UPI00223CE1D9|nr:multiple epidermal growth factor-like domains protein 11 [Pristis pectinata]
MSRAIVCPPGHYCPEGSPSPKMCDSGTWQDLEGQGQCKPCEAGYYCDNSVGPVIDFKFYPCPQGYYCPVGTWAATQHGCPPGTFGQSAGLQDVNDCQPCSPGKYCASFALKAPSGDCLSGFWCKNGSYTESPIDGKTGEPCPTGNYCPSGTSTPIPCPAGTWSNSTGSKTQEECQLCPGGWYCNSTGLKSPSGPCASGYYCTKGAPSPRPTDGITGNPCKVGHFCPEGSIDPIPCKSGTYMMATHASECLVCPAGRYCITGLEPSPCPAGFYCPKGTEYDWQPCPRGTYSPVEGLARVSECRPCDRGKYCAFQNSVEVTGECWEGYYCMEGSESPAPDFSVRGNAGPCPVGHYCPVGTSSPRPCPPGTFSNQSKLVSQSDCTPCIYGHYCGSEGLVTPSGECWGGFYCLQGAKVPRNPVMDGTGGPCPSGHFCPNGTAFPLGCPAGTYNVLEGQSTCRPCVEGYFCPSNTSSYENNICSPGHYCPSGTGSKDKFPCPRGTYNRQSGRISILDCVPCDAGHYCEQVGQEDVTGLCAAGYYCMRMVTTPTPNDGISGAACPPGHFCVSGATAPQPCPVGYYSNSSQNSGMEDCLPCPPGFSCDRKGLTSPSQACDAGFYCPSAQNSSRPAPFVCAKGNRCPQGSAEQQPCSSGTYQDQVGQVQSTKLFMFYSRCV